MVLPIDHPLLKTKVQNKIPIREDLVKELKSKISEDKHSLLDELLADFNEMVNIIENSGRMQTTQNWYGDYLSIATSIFKINCLVAAGANIAGIASAAKINGINL